MAKEKITYDGLQRELKNKTYHPVYLLMGDESYYIDRISNFISDNILTETEKEFNQTVVYGSDISIGTVINMAKRYPMMAEHQVIIVKEAQQIKDIDRLSYYTEHPLSSTILVLCYKNGSADRRKKWVSSIDKIGVVFESKKINTSKLPAFITSYLHYKKIAINVKSVELLAASIGTDLNRMVGELDKLILALPADDLRITPELIEKNIGISKDFNVFELKKALIEKDVYKANQIVQYFYNNPKSNPLQAVLAILFTFYSNLMLAYYAPQKDEQGIANYLGLKQSWQAKEYMIAMKKYTALKVMHIISDIRLFDAKSKGIGAVNLSNEELYKELIFSLLH